MQQNELLVLKLGGSLLTDKTTPYKYHKELLPVIANEIHDCITSSLIKKIVIIHGVGSFGHPPVINYNLHKGYKDPKQLNHLSETQYDVNKLRALISEELLKANIPVNLMHASSFAIGDKGKISRYNFDSLKGFLSLGMVPLIGGDMMYDTSMGFSVCGGDQLAVLLTRELHASYLIFATDVDGVFSSDPKLDSEAILLREIKIDRVEQLLQKMSEEHKDATGRMRGKLLSLLSLKDLINTGLDISIISMQKEGNLKQTLEGKLFNQTKITR